MIWPFLSRLCVLETGVIRNTASICVCRVRSDAGLHRILTPVTNKSTAGGGRMFEKTYHATHPDMMAGVDNDDLRARYLVGGMFVAGQVMLNYSHNERFVIGG